MAETFATNRNTHTIDNVEFTDKLRKEILYTINMIPSKKFELGLSLPKPFKNYPIIMFSFLFYICYKTETHITHNCYT